MSDRGSIYIRASKGVLWWICGLDNEEFILVFSGNLDGHLHNKSGSMILCVRERKLTNSLIVHIVCTYKTIFYDTQRQMFIRLN